MGPKRVLPPHVSNGTKRVTLLSFDLENWSLTLRCSLVTYPGHLFSGRGGLTSLSGKTINVWLKWLELLAWILKLEIKGHPYEMIEAIGRQI